ncbi:MAG: helix-turn-helix transcriptional regulator [Oscillospiraceae bacterium]|nr:helix-turn-helix transcriptional regulator [Oscillospiraceae bacterium]
MAQSNARYVTGTHFTFKHAKGVSDKSGREFHTHHEIIWFMDGQARFISDQFHTPLTPNTLILIPRERYHQLLITGPQEAYHRCVFHFLHIPGLEGLIAKSLTDVQLLQVNPRLRDLFRQAVTVAADPGEDGAAVMQSILTLILYEIVQTHMTPAQEAGDSITNRCIDYVNQHITAPLSLSTLAEVLNVSASYLSHAFKKEMNISLHQYILKKRLVMAHRKIMDGTPAVQAAAECGFQDYSGFYKQFRKMYGQPPGSIARSQP